MQKHEKGIKLIWISNCRASYTTKHKVNILKHKTGGDANFKHLMFNIFM